MSQTVSDPWHDLSFPQAIANAVVVVGPISMGDGNAAVTRERSGGNTGFEFLIDEGG
ncbi:MAG: hypothetical protein AAGH74_01875 [Pseudomonadota bacterium]